MSRHQLAAEGTRLLLFSADKDKYARAMQKALAARGMAMDYDSEKFTLSSGEFGTANLGHSFDEFQLAPLWKRNSTIEHQANAFKEVLRSSLPSPEEARSMVMPRVRERRYWELMKKSMKEDGSQGKYFTPKIFADGHLTLTLVIDSPKTIRDCSKKSMAEMGLDDSTAYEIAADNLKRRPGGFEELRPGLYQSIWKDQYDATRMMYSEFYANLPIKGRPVVMVPNRDVLLITGEQDEVGLETMAQVAVEALKLPRLMSGLAYRLDASWVPFLPPLDHRAYPLMKELQVGQMRNLYDEQRQAMTGGDITDKNGVFISFYTVRKDKLGNFSGFTMLFDGVDMSIAKADEIAFLEPMRDGKPGALIGFADWDVVAEVLEDAFEIEDVYPVRYRVGRFPSGEELARINPVKEK